MFKTKGTKLSRPSTKWSKLILLPLFCCALLTVWYSPASTQNPVFNDKVNIDQLIDTKHNLDYGTFTTTYKAGTDWVGLNNPSTCAPLNCNALNPKVSNALRVKPPQSKAT